MREYVLMKTALSLYFIYNYMDNNSNKDSPHHDTYLNNKKIKNDQFQLLSLHQLAIWHKTNPKTIAQVEYEK